MKDTRIAHETRQKPELHRKRCDNCGTFFMQSREWHKFCKAKCRREWDRNHSAYGQLKEKLAKDIEKEINRQIADVRLAHGKFIAEALSGVITTLDMRFVTRHDISGDEGLNVIRAAVERKRARLSTAAAK